MKLPVYANYTSGGTASLADVPQDWEVKRLKFVLKEPLKYGANESADDDDRELPRYVRITDVDERGSLRDETFRSLPIEVAKHYLLQEGDILFARSGATAGKTFLYDSSWGVCAYAGYLIRARIDTHKASSRFLRYFTDSATYWGWISANFIQATIQNVSAEKYANLPIAFPPVGEQRAIADFLDRETASLDTLMGKKRELIEKLKEKRTALISRIVTRGLNPSVKLKSSGIEWLGEIPEHWEVKRLSSLCAFQQGKAHEPFIDSGGQFICVNSRFVSTEGEIRKYCTENHTPVTKGDVLMVMSDLPNGRALAKAYFVHDDAPYAVNQRVCRLSAMAADSRYLFYQLSRSPGFLRYDDGSNQTHLSNAAFTKFPTATPPLSEQTAIADYLDRETAKIDKMMEKVEAAIEKLQEYRTALITAAVTGKIDVRNSAR